MADFKWNRPAAPLPVEKDFVPYNGCLDAKCAWENFGGLSLDQAYDKFLTNPLCYQEDFMFMGWEAFDYYFPVIDRYLRTVGCEDEWDNCEACILGCGIELQFDWNGAIISGRLCIEISDLAGFVRSNLSRFSLNIKEHKRIDKAWRKVQSKVAEH